MMEFSLDENQFIRQHLQPHERVLWSGSPKQGLVFRRTDFFLIPFGLFWFGFSVLWTVLASSASVFFGLFGLPFLGIGYMMLVGRFIRDRNIRKQTKYVLTDSRVIILRLGNRSRITSYGLDTVNVEDYEMSADGSGTIHLTAPQPFEKNMRAMDWMNFSKVMPAIEFIPDVQMVYQKIMTARRNLRPPASPQSGEAIGAG